MKRSLEELPSKDDNHHVEENIIISNTFEILQNSSSTNCSSYFTIGCELMDKVNADQDDYLKAMQYFMKGSEEGCLKSTHKIGNLYDKGLGVEQDFEKAMEWYLKSAEGGLSKSQCNIGYMYEHGEGVSQDYSKAIEWYLKAAEKDNAGAQFNIGLMYDDGLGVSQDYSKAFEWYLKSAEGGLSKSQCNIGLMYELGRGVQKDYSKAIEWYLKAAENNNAGAQFNIGLMYDDGLGVSQDYSKAFEWYLKSANNDYTDAVFNIGYCYKHGQGVEKDLSKAFEWYLKAAENNDAQAQSILGSMYEEGEGVSKDYSKAMEWYLKAAEKGNRSAKANISTMYANGFGVEKNFKKEIYWLSRYFNNYNFTFIENPYVEFGIQYFEIQNEELSDSEILKSNIEDVIIRFEKKDFKISQHYLKSCKYLQTMMNSNWKDFNSKENDNIILDLISIQHEIFQHNTGESEQFDIYEIFEKYIEYLTDDIIPNDFEMNLKLIELSRYLQDDECIFKIVKESSIVIRMYIISIFEIVIEAIDYAIASCYVMDNEIEMNEIPLKVIEWLLNETELSLPAKKKLLQLTQLYLQDSQMKMKPINDNDNKIIHVSFTQMIKK